ncbi:MAG: hypothetical protein IJW76_00545 [Clostridia bacterium]|nr:hypothetical protein [Clostridia bacterium]
MKKIIALILATIMVMFAVAACGGNKPAETTAKPNTPDNGSTSTSTTAQSTTQATTTTEQVVVPDPYTALAYLPTGKDVAVNVVTGEEIGKLTAGTGIELKGGYFYVVDVVPAEGKQTATKEIGSAVTDKKVALGWTNVMSNGKVLSYTSYFHREKAASGKTSDGTALGTLNYNFCYMDLATLNTALEGTGLGNFGTITLKALAGEATSFAFGTDPDSEELITDYKWNFVYVGYNGESYGKATGTTYTPVAMNAKDIIYSACDVALGNEIGTLRGLNVTAMDNYKAPESVVAFNGKYNGTSIQETHVANFKNGFVPVKYAAAKKNYDATITGDVTEASVAATLATANAALTAAQKAFDDAVAANASVKALKEALDAAAAALEAAKQAAYEAKATHETEKAKDKNSQATADAQAVRTEKEAAQTTAQAAYDAAKAAFDGAVASDSSLAALNTTLTDATTAQKTANTNQTRVDEYKKWSELYAKFTAAYADLANVALWNTEDMANSAIINMFKGVEEPVLPSFTYYYNEATDTYTVFVTSMTAENMVEFFYNNDAIK